tara:strand:- start:1640 stop:1840 length:201 start_codon:yes stop_codon:yes gene_type:complete
MALFTPLEQLRDMQQWAAAQTLISDPYQENPGRHLASSVAASILVSSVESSISEPSDLLSEDNWTL